MSDQPPSSYDFVPLPDRAPLKFPDGAHVALIFTINIEYWEPFRPGQKEPMFPGGPATIPHALPGDVLDTANWTWREYGQRDRHLAAHGCVRQDWASRRRAPATA